MKKQIIMYAVFIILIGVSVFLATKLYYQSENTSTFTETTLNNPLDTSDWKSYSDKASGITLKYPDTWDKFNCTERDSDKDNCFIFSAKLDQERLDSGIKFYTSDLKLPEIMDWDLHTISMERNSTDSGHRYIIRRIFTADPSGYIDVYYIPNYVSKDPFISDEYPNKEAYDLVQSYKQKPQIIAITSQPTPTMTENPEYDKLKKEIMMAILNSVDY